MTKLQDKLAQHDIDAEQWAQAELRNWGKMLRCQSSPFPKGFTPDPMFREIVAGYRETSSRESYNEDRAVVTMDLVNTLITKERDKLAIYYYYAEKHTNDNVAISLESFNKTLTKAGEHTMGESSFRALLKKVEVQIGTGLILRDVWLSSIAV